MSDAVRFERVVKRYLRGGPRYASLRAELGRAVRGWLPGGRHYGHSEGGKLALDDVSFAVQEGQSFAIIGPNGAGKTTVLKLASRISHPTGGRIRVRGRVGALIEVGSGVHPELTGRENIWLYGQILGMAKAEIRRRFEEIVGFSDLADALDVPVKMYSSGMQVRLGFSIAAHLDPDIFVVDEALAVGDAGFQAKCVQRMTELVGEGRTLLFVSHHLEAVEALCDRALFLLGGRVQHEGPSAEVIRRYLNWTEERRIQLLGGAQSHGPLRIVAASCHGLDGAERYNFRPGEGIEIRLRFAGEGPLERPHVNIGITDGRPGLLIQCSMLHDGRVPERVGSEWECRCRIERLPLRPRLYQVYCDVYGSEGLGSLTPWSHVSVFRIIGEGGEGPLAVSDRFTSGPVEVSYSWEIAS